jgi:hypothetical protein
LVSSRGGDLAKHFFVGFQLDVNEVLELLGLELLTNLVRRP